MIKVAIGIKMKGDICRMGRYPFSFVLVYTFTFLTLKKTCFYLDLYLK